MADSLREAGLLVRSLRTALTQGEAGLRSIPGLLLRIIEDNLWQDRIELLTGQPVHFDRFVDFVTTPAIEGLGEDLNSLFRLCAANDEALTALTRVTTGTHGGDRRSADYEIKSDNVTFDSSYDRGNSKTYGLRWLDANRPDLHTAVVRKELSVNAAMQQAGRRDKTLSISATHADRAAATLRRSCTPAFIAELIHLLEEE